MNLFEIFARIGINDDEFNNGINRATSKGKSFGSTVGGAISGGISAGAKIATTAILAVGTGLATIAGLAVKGYAQYEQLIGGVETLFGTGGKNLQEYASSVGKTTEQAKAKFDKLILSQETVVKNASNAYKTAGMSANEYMETVTGFSASLLQSLGGDTEKAAQYADLALTDMSDNANKMGTSIESIKATYQNFAKQTYMMLDNLKLGYGGTKKEMERLLEDAGKISKVKYDINNLADVYTALNVIQTQLGITGTTAKEASTTIQGSVAMTKSAWDNLVVGLADNNADINQLVANLIESAGIASTNILPTIETAIKGIATLVEQLAPKIAEMIPAMITDVLPGLLTAATSVVQSLAEALPALISGIVPSIIKIIASETPKLIESAIAIVQALIDGIKDNKDTIVNGAIEIISALTKGILDLLPEILSLGIEVILGFANGITKELPKLIPIAVDTVMKLVDGILDNIDLIVDGAIALVFGLADAIIDNLPTLVEKAPEIVEKLVNAIIDNAPKLFVASVQLVLKLAESIITNLPKILETGVKIVLSIVEGIGKVAQDIGKEASKLIDTFKEKFKNFDWMQLGKDIINGIVSGIKNIGSSIGNTLKSIAGSALKVMKGAIDSNSPSKKFRDQIGKPIIEGVIVGMTDTEPLLMKTMVNIGNKLLAVDKRISDDIARLKKESVIILGEEIEGLDQRAISERYVTATLLETQLVTEINDKIAKLTQEKTKSKNEATKQAEIEHLNAQKSILEELRSAYETAYTEIENKQTTMANKLKAFGELYTKTGGSELEFIQLGDIQSDIDALNLYGDSLEKLKARGVSQEFIDQIVNMGVDEAITYTGLLLSQTSNAFTKYYALWEEKQRTAKTVAERFYGDQLNDLKTKFSNKILLQMGKMPDETQKIGKNVAEALAKGITNSKNVVIDSVNKVIDDMIEASKNKLKIKSPSVVYKDMGKMLPSGLADGFIEGMKSAKVDMANAMPMSLDAKLKNNNTLSSNNSGGIVINVSADVLQQSDNYLLAKNIANVIKRQVNAGESGVNYAY